MGTPVPYPSVSHATDCIGCAFPEPTLWLPGETPEFVYAYFAGIEECPLAIKHPPNGQTFKLTQVPLDPCRWRHEGSDWIVDWLAYDPVFGESILTLWEVGGLLQFVSRFDNCPPECHVYHSTIEVCAWPVAARFGLGVIHWMGITLHIIVGLNLPTSSKIMHELFVTDDDKIVHKFCIPGYSINVKVLTS